MILQQGPIKAVIGLGNPGPHYRFMRHNVGFMVVDALASHYAGHWKEYDQLAATTVEINSQNILLIKPLTFMNESGRVLGWLSKKGINAANILVVHDELELPFGKVGVKSGGSARGHNGVRSIIASGGDAFLRLRCGIDRPENRDDVASYVLCDFTEGDAPVAALINAACAEVERLIV